MRALGFLKEFAERKTETKEERERVEKLALDLERENAKDEKAAMRAAYAGFLADCPLERNTILYEAFGGRGMICNPYAIFKYLMSRAEYQKYKHIWAIDDFSDNGAALKEYENCSNISFVKYQSKEYLHALATAKYLINNVSFPGFFVKRKGQVYLNTWHGSPMKTMGFDIPGGNVSSGNSAKNLLCADYLLSQSPYMTKKAWLESYKLDGIYEGTILENGFPRNDVFFQNGRDQILAKLVEQGIKIDKSKKTILYAPTWKGEKYGAPQTGLEEYYKVIETIEKSVDTDKYQVLVKPHQIVYYHIKKEGGTTDQFLPATFDTNEILSAADVLISDYSSIHFDFLVSGKPLVFFLPDFDEFQDYRGLYFGLDKLPGPIVKSYEELGECFSHLEEAVKPYEEKYREEKSWGCPRDDGKVCQKVAETVFGKRHAGVEVKCGSAKKKKLLLYAGDFEKNDTTAGFFSLLNVIDYQRIDVTVLAQSSSDAGNRRIFSLPREVRVLYWKPYYAASSQEYARHILSENEKVCPPYEFYRREIRRAVGDCTFDAAVDFTGTSGIFSKLAAHMQGTRDITKEVRSLPTPVDFRRISEEEERETIVRFGSEEYLIADIKEGNGTIELETLEFPSADKPTVVTLGNFLPENHYGELIRIFDKIYKERRDAQLYFLGDGPQREKIEKICKEHNLTEAVHFLGEVKYPLSFLKRCQCFVLESKMGEQSPDFVTARALISRAEANYSKLSTVLKGEAETVFDPKSYNREIKKELESLLEVGL